jgi:hypothetical protein
VSRGGRGERLHSERHGTGMISKRSFFKTIGAIVAAVAIAPEIVFSSRLRPTIDFVPFWYQTTRRSICFSKDYIDVFKKLMESNVYFQEMGDVR